MHDPDKSKKISRTKGEEASASSSSLNWRLYSVEELISFRDQITAVLPPLSLKDIDMEQELLLQYQSLRALQNTVLTDEETPVNQRAQVANSVSSVLAKIGDLQQTLYDSERLKKIEKVLIQSLDHLPVPVKEAFLTEYEKELENV